MSSRLIALAVALVVVGCGSRSRQQQVRKPGEEYLQVIEIEGNQAISDQTLIRGLALSRAVQGGRAVDDYQLGLDVTRIEGAYKRRGYFNVQVEPQITKRGDAQRLVFLVKEGPRATASVEITGLPPELSRDDAQALIGIVDGQPFDYWTYAKAKPRLVAAVQDAGYAHAQLEATVLADRKTNQAVLRYALDTGPRARFGELEIVGTSGPLADAIRRRVGFAAGDPYSVTAIAQAQQGIHAIGRFASVRVDVDRSAVADVVPIKVTVTEAKRNEARAGGGAGLDVLTYQARMRVSYSHRGYPSPLTTLGAEFRPALVALRDDCVWYEVWTCKRNWRIRLLGTATQQDLFMPGVQGDVEGGLDYLALEAYTMQGARLRTGLSRAFMSKRIVARIGWQLAGYDFTDLSRALAPATAEDPELASRIGVDQFQRLGAFTQGIALDLRDNPVSPRFGAYAELRIAEGTALAGGAFDYLQITPDVRTYLPLGRAVLAARARLGVIRGEVPPTERYFAGGASSHRGFAERRLSPTARSRPRDPAMPDPQLPDPPVTVVVGGAASFETGIELRTHFRPFGIKVGVVTFLDGGDVTERPGQLSLGNLHWAVGFGIRPYYLPLGPIRLEVAYRLNRTSATDPYPNDRVNFLISVGEAY
jgi:outer membrane protein assembly factor BamA